MTKLFKRLVQEEDGQGMVEYALIIVLVSIAAYAMLHGLGDKIKGVFEDITGSLSGAAPTT